MQESPASRSAKTFAACVVATVLLLLAAYSNHFHNSFHFDDFHTVTGNPAIRSLTNIPRFFEDGTTFSVLPTNQGWRPLVSTTLALDYWLGGGYNVFYFHIGTFLTFLLLLVTLYVMALNLYNRAGRPGPGIDDAPSGGGQDRVDGWHGVRGTANEYAALFTAALFGLHPACAETVNYIIQRADVYVALGFTSSMALFLTRPQWRRYGFYLVPFLLAAMAKPTALIFPVLLLAWLLIYGERLVWMIPTLGVGLLMAFVQKVMTPPTYAFGGADPFGYRITQGWVTAHFLRIFFWPTTLTADSDMTAYHSFFEPHVMLGFALVMLLLERLAFACSRPATLPIAFGLAWFAITSLPTALAPLAEVTNDHRMFLPFIGLTMAVVWSARLLLHRHPIGRRVLVAMSIVILGALAVGTHERNAVWHDERSLWTDVVVKSPRNGRGWMNYGLTFLNVGKYDDALRCFNTALQYTPNYSLLETNLGIAYGAMRRDDEARKHFERGLSLDTVSGTSSFLYGRWLHQKRQDEEAVAVLKKGLQTNPHSIGCRNLLMQVYRDSHDWVKLNQIIDDTRHVTPDDAEVNTYATMARDESARDIAAAQRATQKRPGAAAYIELSLQYHRAGRYDDAIQAAQTALKFDPKRAEAWNNIAAANLGKKNWDAAIVAARRALALKPAFTLARNNLMYARSEKAAGH